MAKALDCGSSHESSILSSRPKWAVRITGLLTACNREMRVRFSHRPPKFGSGTRRQSAGLKSQWIRFNSVPSHQTSGRVAWLVEGTQIRVIGERRSQMPFFVLVMFVKVTYEAIR